MPDAATPSVEPQTDRAAKMGERVALAIFVIISILFVISSTWQLTIGVFYPNETAGRPASLDGRSACAVDLRAMSASVDAAVRTRGPDPSDADAAAAQFAQRLSRSGAVATPFRLSARGSRGVQPHSSPFLG